MKFTFLFSFLFIVVSQSLFCQTTPIKDVHITLLSEKNPIVMTDSLLLDVMVIDSSLTEFYANSTFDVGVSILLSDTTDIDKINIKLGASKGGSDLFNDFLSFQQIPAKKTGYIYRNKLFVNLDIGRFNDLKEVHCEVSVIRPNLSSTKPFVRSVAIK